MDSSGLRKVFLKLLIVAKARINDGFCYIGWDLDRYKLARPILWLDNPRWSSKDDKLRVGETHLFKVVSHGTVKKVFGIMDPINGKLFFERTQCPSDCPLIQRHQFCRNPRWAENKTWNPNIAPSNCKTHQNVLVKFDPKIELVILTSGYNVTFY